MPRAIEDILDDFALIDDWEDRYRYVIDLGKALAPLPDEARTDANKVPGCASQVWLSTRVSSTPNGPVVQLEGDSDAHIVKGLVAIMLAIYSGRTAQDILTVDGLEMFARLGLREHLTPQRSNGVRAMMERIRSEARTALAAA